MIKVSDQEIEINGAEALELVNSLWSQKRQSTLASLFDLQMQQIREKLESKEELSPATTTPPLAEKRSRKKLL